MAEAIDVLVSARVRGLWAVRLAVPPLLVARWLLRRAGVDVQIRAGRRVVSREFVRPDIRVEMKVNP